MIMDSGIIESIKKNLGIVGNDPMLNQAISTAVQVAPIQLSALIIGESGSGKEFFPQIIHNYSPRKHNNYVAVNCGGIPEGTIDSELFGHEKGAFTGAISERKGYFEMADKGTIFLDEIGELPLSTQAKLLRVLERGEYMRVGSSAVKKTDVRIIAATNVDLEDAIAHGRFREDLFYRLNGVMVHVPSLRNRRNDIPALFHRFTNDFADKNHIQPVRLSDSAIDAIKAYEWPGNVRQLKNFAEQLTVLSEKRAVDANDILPYIPKRSSEMLVMSGASEQHSYSNEREILYKILFDMRKDVTDLKKLVVELINGNGDRVSQENAQIIKRLYQTEDGNFLSSKISEFDKSAENSVYSFENVGRDSQTDEARVTEVTPEVVSPDVYSISDSEKELITRALNKYRGNRRKAAAELGISERTLFRKIHNYDIRS